MMQLNLASLSGKLRDLEYFQIKTLKNLDFDREKELRDSLLKLGISFPRYQQCFLLVRLEEIKISHLLDIVSKLFPEFLSDANDLSRIDIPYERKLENYFFPWILSDLLFYRVLTLNSTAEISQITPSQSKFHLVSIGKRDKRILFNNNGRNYAFNFKFYFNNMQPLVQINYISIKDFNPSSAPLKAEERSLRNKEILNILSRDQYFLGGQLFQMNPKYLSMSNKIQEQEC